MNKLKSCLSNYKVLLVAIIIIALPAIGEMSLNTLLGISDTLMISHFIGSEALAAVGFANQIIFMLIFIFSSFNTGSTAMISRSYGEKDYEKLKKTAGQTVFINSIIGIIITILSLIFDKQIFSIYDMSPEVLELTLSYFNIIVYGVLFMFLSFSYAAILRGAGDTVTPMIITAIANVLNIIGNYVLIKGIGPFPTLGIEGAAWSTTISRLIATLMYTYILFIKNGRLKISIKDLKITKKIIKPLWNLSYPGAIEQALMQISFVVAGVVVSLLDTNSEAAFRILINIESISFMPAVGLSIAAATLVGKALGEKDIKKASEIGYASTALGVIWGVIMGIIFLAFPKQLLKVFTPKMDIILLSISAMYVAGFNQPFLNFMIVMSGALRGAGDTRAVMIITSLRLWILFIPITYISIIKFNHGVAGVWYGEIISFFIFCIIIFLRFKSKKWAEIDIS